MSRVGLCSTFSYTECQVLVCVLVSLTLSVKFGLCSSVTYTECQVLVFVLVFLTLGVRSWLVLLFDLH